MKRVKRLPPPSPERALLAFAKPLLADVADVTGAQAVNVTEKVLKVAVALWNAVTLDERGDPSALAALEEIVATMPAHLQAAARAMIEERRASFSRDDSLLAELHVDVDDAGKLQVQVARVDA